MITKLDVPYYISTQQIHPVNPQNSKKNREHAPRTTDVQHSFTVNILIKN